MNCASAGMNVLTGALSEMVITFPLAVIPLMVFVFVPLTSSLPTICLNAFT